MVRILFFCFLICTCFQALSQEIDFESFKGQEVALEMSSKPELMHFYNYESFEDGNKKIIASVLSSNSVEGALSNLYRTNFGQEEFSLECEYKVYKYVGQDTFCVLRYWDTKQANTKKSKSFINESGNWKEISQSPELNSWEYILKSLSFSDFLSTVNSNQFKETPDLNILRIEYHDAQNHFKPDVFARLLKEKNPVLMSYITNE